MNVLDGAQSHAELRNVDRDIAKNLEKQNRKTK